MNNEIERNNKILSDIIVHTKYARHLPQKNRRENWSELVERNKQMHIRNYPQIADEIEQVYNDFVLTKKVLPSMRSMQFGGRAIEINNSRIYNCAYLPVDSIYSFSETMFLLLGGTGVGYSVQKHHVEKLPEIQKPNYNRKRRYVIQDSIIGWADAVKVLFKSYTGQVSSHIEFDFSDIRDKGELLITAGGKAPGPEPLRIALTQIEAVLREKEDRTKLSTLEAHDIMCYIADAVLAGGIRRAAMIALFNIDDADMLACKAGEWYIKNPQRGRANNSAVILRHKITEEKFAELWERIRASGSGEPGFYLTNNMDWGTNPCCLTPETIVSTDDGKEWTIKELVELYENGGELPNVLSYNTETCEIETKEITDGLLTRKNADVISLELEDGSIVKMTPDHRVFTENRGYVEAKDLTEDDILLKI